jgi:2-amino-4-hydroxy-6-hydroxymethyldihydropteridine diphosphokinase
VPKPPSDYYVGPGTVQAADGVAGMVLIGIGSNRGDSVRIVLSSIVALRRFAVRDFRASSLWRTSPVDCPPDAADFINAAVGFEPHPELTPEALLAALKALEREFEPRDVGVRNAPRELDLDLLVFGAERRNTAAFTLPHPRAALRRFVLAPVAEIAPDLRWPDARASVAELLAGLHSGERVERLCAGADNPDSIGR